VLDSKSMHASFGFKTSEIMRGRDAVEKVKEEVRKHKRLCTDILEWGDTVEKIAQVAEMKQVEKICLHVPKGDAFFANTVEEIRQRTSIPIELISSKK
ncbi:MAG: hypothetical protein AABY11_03825, partial [archaeon]